MSDYNSIVLGTAAHLDFLSYKRYSAVVPGYKVQMGVAIQDAYFNYKPYVAYNKAKGTDSSMASGASMELDYTSFQFGVVISFHKGIYYRF